MKKFFLLSLLASVVAVPAFAASEDVAAQEAAIKKAMPAQVKITKAKVEGRYVLQYADPVIKNSYKSVQVGMENSKHNCVKISYTLNGVKQEDNWYGADFSRTVVLLEEGTQDLVFMTAEQKKLIEEADLDLKDKKALVAFVRDEDKQATNKIRSFIGVREQAAEIEAAQKEAEEAAAQEEEQEAVEEVISEDKVVEEAAATEENSAEEATKALETTEATDSDVKEDAAVTEENSTEEATPAPEAKEAEAAQEEQK